MSRIRGLILTGLVTLGASAGGLLFAAMPALAVAPEAPVTEAPTPIGGTTATLKGELIPGATTEKVAYHFAYTAGQGVGCTESGLTAPEPFPEAEDNHEKVSTPVTGLEGNTEYAVCLIAANPAEPAEATQGSSVTFKTSAIKPVIVSESSAVTPSTATLEAQVNPENQQTELCVFEYGATASYGHVIPCEPATLEGGSVVAATAHLKGLAPASTDHWRVVVKNATGEEKGAGQVFTTNTLERPIVSGETAAVTPVGATLEAVVNPNYQSTTYKFEYATSKAAIGTPAAMEVGEGSFGEEFAENHVSASIGPLTPSTPYFYRVVATNAIGTQDGPTEELKTSALAAPIVNGENASGLNSTSEKLEAVLNPNYQETTYFFEYATSEEAVSKGEGTIVQGAPPATALPAVSEELPVSVTVTGLTPNTPYFFRVVATNASGPADGTPATFTPVIAPVISTGEPQSITANNATVTGTVNPEGAETSYHYEYTYQAGYEAGLTSNPGDPYAYGGGVTPEVKVEPTDDTVHAVNGILSGLAPGTTFHYALVAKNADGTIVISADQTFTTSAAPPAAPAPVTGTSGETSPAPAALPATLPLIAYTSIAQLDATEAKEGKAVNPPSTKSLTKAEKLKKALKACKRNRKSSKRAACERQAHKKFGAVRKRTKA